MLQGSEFAPEIATIWYSRNPEIADFCRLAGRQFRSYSITISSLPIRPPRFPLSGGDARRYFTAIWEASRRKIWGWSRKVAICPVIRTILPLSADKAWKLILFQRLT